MSVLEPIVRASASAFAPLADGLADADAFTLLLAQLGWRVRVSVADLVRINEIFPVAADVARVLADVTALEGMEGPERIAAVVALAEDVAAIADAVAALAELDADDLVGLRAPLGDPSFWAELAADLPHALAAAWLQAEAAPVYGLLLGAGLLVPVQTTDLRRTRWRFDWTALGALAEDPAGYVRDRYGFGGTTFAYPVLLARLGDLFARIGLSVQIRPMAARTATALGVDTAGAPPPVQQVELRFFHGRGPLGTLVEAGVILAPTPSAPGGVVGDGLYFGSLVRAAAGTSIVLDDEWVLSVGAAADATAGLGVAVRPSGVEVVGSGTSIETTLTLTGAPASPWMLIGGPAGARVELSGLTVTLGLTGTTADPEAYVSLAAPGGGLAAVVAPGEGDAFVRDLLGTAELRAEVDGPLRWSTRDGLLLGGAFGLTATLPVNRQLGPVFVGELEAEVGAGATGATVEARLSAGVALGPFYLVIEGIGAGFDFVPTEDGDGFGGLDGALRFVAPTGVGVACDVEVVSGGGYLEIDPEEGRYAGAVELQIMGVGLTAVGVLSTRLPSGDEGWALLLSIASEFVPIQLGFGFTLDGVGGLVAVNRTLDATVLQDGLKSGSLDALLFPEDPLADVAGLLSLLDEAFPIAEGQFTFGPIAQIGWGIPTVMTAQVGVIISLPDPVTIALVGQFTALLPTPDEALVELHLDVLGVVDLAAGTVSVDAVLRDSYIVGLTLRGAMAFRASFLGDPTFLLSFGGFHPDFQPPAGVPDLDRLSVGLDLGDEIQVSLETYLAITSNTLQTGARLYAVAASGKFTAEGEVVFNALFTFSPFSFRVDVGFAVEVRYDDWTLMGVELSLVFSGPEPWYAVGTATFTFLGADIHFHVEGSLGGGAAAARVDPVDVGALLAADLLLPEAWAAAPPDATEVTLRTAGGTDDWAHPDGAVEVRQHRAPLGRTLQMFGNAAVLGDDTFTLEAATIGSVAVTDAADLDDWFAPAQFFKQAPAKRLSAPSFEREACGLAFGGSTARGGPASASTLDYECFTIDPQAPAVAGRVARRLPAVDLGSAAPRSLSAQAAAKRPTARGRVPSSVSVTPTAWVVARVDTLVVATSVLPEPGTHAAAQAALDAWLVTRPQDAATYQVVPQAEAWQEAS